MTAAYNTNGVLAHLYDHETIACPCGETVGYRLSRCPSLLRCRACDAPWSPPAARKAPPRELAVQALIDAWDHAAARSLAGEHSHAIPNSLYDALIEARAALEAH